MWFYSTDIEKIRYTNLVKMQEVLEQKLDKALSTGNYKKASKLLSRLNTIEYNKRSIPQWIEDDSPLWDFNSKTKEL